MELANTPGTEENLLQVIKLSIRLTDSSENSKIVNEVSFTVRRGETFALVGESGGGKTMTALSVIQLLPENMVISEATQILFQQQDLLQLSEVAMRRIRGKRIGLVFQEPMTALNPVFTVGEQIAEVLRYHEVLSRRAEQRRVVELLCAVEIAEPKRCMRLYPHQLSGGMQQRVLIAIAVAAKPELLIADEPTSALDVTTQMQILALLQRLQQQLGMSIVLITHDLGIVRRMADRVAVMYQGRIIEQNTCEEFFSGPQQEYSRRLLAALPNVEHKPIPANRPILEVRDLKIHFPIHKGIFKRIVGWIKAVDGISFSVAEGKTLAIVGESGSGKTTLAKGVIHLLPVTAGQILFKAIDLNNLSSKALRHLRKDIQIVFQDPYSSLNPRMIIADIITEGLVALGQIKTQTEKLAQVDQLLALVELPLNSKFRYPHEFSGGQRQRICIARALALSPKLLICDEPTSALDISVQTQVLHLLKRLQEELGLSYLFITHNLALVAYMADEVAVMRHGHIVEQGPVDVILKTPQHPYTQALLATVV